MDTNISNEGTIKKEFYSKLKLAKPLRPIIGKPLEKILYINTLDYWYHRTIQAKGNTFPEKILNAFNITLKLKESDLDNIPKEGPAIFIANHPFGGIEGIALSVILSQLRNDFKIMANHYLSIIPELRDLFIFVDPFKTKNSNYNNISQLKKTICWVNNGGLLVIFPAGEVSHYNLAEGKITDPPWQENVEKLINKISAPVIPVFFEGANKLAFQILGIIHPLLRTVRLPAELLNKQNATLSLHVGKPITHKQLIKYNDAKSKLSYLRRRTYNLAHRQRFMDTTKINENNSMQQIVAAKNRKHINQEIRTLPICQILLDQNSSNVFYAYAHQIPNLLHEIGREREINFRAVNEGTGKCIDLDEFDEHYIHLIAWDKDQHQIIGSYRLGLTDLIIKDFGKQGLYTNTLFKLKSWFFKEICPAIEMGRSFITQDYQRSFNSLYMLWRGIGEFIVRNPHYRYLFGPVSISNEYALTSQRLMLRFLSDNYGNQRLSRSVSPINSIGKRIKSIKLTAKESKDLAELEELITDIEGKISSVPILIKQYLKLGAEFIAFNRDPDFSDVLDGLIVVDLVKTDLKILNRYMGQTGALFYTQYHHIRNQSFNKN